MTRRVNSPYSKWHGQVFTFTPATNDPSYLVSAPPSSLVFHESELEEVEEQQETPKTTIDQIKQQLRDIIELSDKATPAPWEWTDESKDDDALPYVAQCAYLGDTLITLCDTYENSREDCALASRSRNLTPKMVRALLTTIDAIETALHYAHFVEKQDYEELAKSLETIRREWEGQA